MILIIKGEIIMNNNELFYRTSICYFCGNDKGTISIPTASVPDQSIIPDRIFVDYTPCKCCSDKFSSGILVLRVEAVSEPPTTPPIIPGYTPTGKWVLVPDDTVGEIFLSPYKEKILEDRHALLNAEQFDKLFGALDFAQSDTVDVEVVTESE
jgi:hypothetical protein